MRNIKMREQRIGYLIEQLTESRLSGEEGLELSLLLVAADMRAQVVTALAAAMENEYAEPQWKGERLDEMLKAVLSADKTAAPVEIARAKIFSIRRLAV